MVMAVGFAFSTVIDLMISIIDDLLVLGDFVNFTPFRRELITLTVNSNTEILLKAGLFSIIFLIIMVLLTHRIFKRAEIK